MRHGRGKKSKTKTIRGFKEIGKSMACFKTWDLERRCCLTKKYKYIYIEKNIYVSWQRELWAILSLYLPIGITSVESNLPVIPEKSHS